MAYISHIFFYIKNMNKNLSEFSKKVYDLLKEQPDECYGIATEYEDFVRHKSQDIDEFIEESYKNGKTVKETTEDLIEEVYYHWHLYRN